MKANIKKMSEDLLKKLREAPCAYPGCERKQFISNSIPVIKILESGKVEVEENRAQVLPWCQYHFFLAGAGLFGAEESAEGPMLHGPFDIIHIIETVVDAKKEFKKFEQYAKEKELKKNE